MAAAEYRFLEVRAEGRMLTGAALVYGDTARLPFGLERFQAGAFGNLDAADVLLNVQHDRRRPLARTGGGGLVLTDSPERLEIRADLPPTREADDALELVRRGVLRGLSVEFNPVRERNEGRLRVIERAALSGVGVVDRPAYGQSAVAVREVEYRQGRLRLSWSYEADTVISNSGRRRKERVNPGAFDLDNNELYADREIDLFFGDRNQPLASRRAGTLDLVDGRDAIALTVARMPNTSYSQDLERLLEENQLAFGVRADYVIAPDGLTEVPDASPGAAEGVTIGVVNRAVLTGFALVSRQPRGNPGEVAYDPPERQRRRKIWL